MLLFQTLFDVICCTPRKHRRLYAGPAGHSFALLTEKRTTAKTFLDLALFSVKINPIPALHKITRVKERLF